MSTIINHPALVLTPAFSFWTYGPVRDNGCCAYRRNEPKICLSFRLTWVNTLLTTGGMVALILITMHYSILTGESDDIDFLYLIFSGAFLPLAIICQLLVQFLNKCKWLCFGCLCCCCWMRYEDCCFPMTQKAVYDTENPHQ